MADLNWIAVDWGTSNVRLWGMSPDNSIVFENASSQGMSRIKPADYPDVLSTLAASVPAAARRGMPVVVCGMAGARQGWCEAPYAEVPVSLADFGETSVCPPSPDGFAIHILPGICQATAGHEDVMRGEETQLLGLCALRPGFTGTVCMPGTHSKWVQIDQGQLNEFQSAMTGELYEVLRLHSVLRHSVGETTDGPHLEDGIADGLRAGLERPERLIAQTFRTRAASLLSGRPPDWCAGYLSGLLVGTEIGAFRSSRGPRPVVLIGSARLCRLYGAALSKDGAQSEILDPTEATLAGLVAAKRRIFDG